jgi:hypothetical protein
MIAHVDALDSLMDTEVSERVCDSSMHTLESRILYSEAALRGVGSGQHPDSFRNLLHPKVRDAIRFLLGWLFLHRRLRARQRGSRSEDLSDLAPDRLITSEGRYSFLSE